MWPVCLEARKLWGSHLFMIRVGSQGLSQTWDIIAKHWSSDLRATVLGFFCRANGGCMSALCSVSFSENGHKSSDFLMTSLEELNDIIHSEESIVHSELDDIVLTQWRVWRKTFSKKQFLMIFLWFPIKEMNLSFLSLQNLDLSFSLARLCCWDFI